MGLVEGDEVLFSFEHFNLQVVSIVKLGQGSGKDRQGMAVKANIIYIVYACTSLESSLPHLQPLVHS